MIGTPFGCLVRLALAMGVSHFSLASAAEPLGEPGGEMDRQARNKTDRWTLATHDTEFRIGVVGNRPVVQRLCIPGDSRNWLNQPEMVPLPGKAVCDQATIALAWKFEDGAFDKHTSTLTLIFTNSTPALRHRQFFQARSGHGPVRLWSETENLSGGPINVHVPACLALTSIAPGAPSFVWWVNRGGNDARKQGGTFTEPVTKALNKSLPVGPSGAFPIPWLAVQVQDQRGLYVGWEYSGNGTLQAVASPDGATLALRFLLAEAQLPIPAGKTLWIPPSFVGCYRGDVDDGSYCLHRFYLETLRPHLPKNCPDPILTMNVFFDAADEGKLMAHLKLAQEFGFEAFVVDAIWFPGPWGTHEGPWIWDLKRYPNGGRPFHDFCQTHQMRFGQWCAWGRNYDQAEELTRQIVADNRLDYFKHDMGLIPGGSYARTLGYYRIQESLRRSFPDLILENCDAGGCLKDFGAMSRAHYVVTTDDLGSLADRMGIYDSTFVFPPMVLQNYTWLRSGDRPGPFLWRSGMMGAWVLDTPALPGEAESIKKATAIYKSWIRPILQDCKVHHILPRPDGKRWDGLFYWGPGLKKGIFFIFRPQSDESRQVIKLKGLESGQRYSVSCQEGSIQPGEKTGKDLMETGLEIGLPAPNTSDLIFIQDVVAGRPAEAKNRPQP